MMSPGPELSTASTEPATATPKPTITIALNITAPTTTTTATTTPATTIPTLQTLLSLLDLHSCLPALSPAK